MADYVPEFGNAVREALGERSYRQVAPRVGVSATYIGDMVLGRVPRRQVVVAFAEACGLSREQTSRLLLLAGYAPLESTNGAGSPADLLIDGWQALVTAHPDVEIPFPLLQGGARALTEEEAQSILAGIEARIARGGYRKKG